MNYVTQTCQSWAMRGGQVSNLSQARKCCCFTTRSFPFLTLPSTFLLSETEAETPPNKTKTKPNQTKLKKTAKTQQKNPKQNQSPQKPLPRRVKIAVSIAILVAKNRRQRALLMPTV